MDEKLLHFIWKNALFDATNLYTTSHEKVLIHHVGTHNGNEGPDFVNCKITIGNVAWQGSVEIDLYSSGWHSHKHHLHAMYETVILHVVWHDDHTIIRADGTQIPTLLLKNVVRTDILLRANGLMKNSDDIPCQSQWQDIEPVVKYTMIDKAMAERLKRKAASIETIFNKYINDWQQTTYAMICTHMGYKVNNEAFAMLAERLPYKIIAKHTHNLFELEALLLGISGLIYDAKDEYRQKLFTEWKYLCNKYSLHDVQMHRHHWNLLRLRPANLPVVRLVQLAALLHHMPHIVDIVSYPHLADSLQTMMRSEVSDFWQKNAIFDSEIDNQKLNMGSESINSLIINAIVPVMVFYAQYHSHQWFMDKAINILENIDAENNIITKKWKKLGTPSKNSSDSQGLIELYNEYCMHKRCIECHIGYQLIAAQ
ncbi:MAG: DUF2851 family protein [Cytophagales bacterium]|nr:DUF2851 family protein [Cytophagales bacterium]